MAGNSYRFPSDLLDSPEYGHMVQFSAYTPQSFVQAAAANSGLINGRQMLDSFQLYMPGGGQGAPLSFQQAHEYDEVKLSRIGTGAGSGVMSAIVGIGADTLGKAGQLAGGLFRTQINPGVEVLYRGTELRKFDFSFMFAPQSKPDSDMLYGVSTGTGLLNRFRYYAAPEISGVLDLAFYSPSEWEIDFWVKDANGGWKENAKLPKIAKGVLVRVDVDYTPDSEYSTFESGDPVTSRLTLRFVEMQIVDKTLIGQGY